MSFGYQLKSSRNASGKTQVLLNLEVCVAKWISPGGLLRKSWWGVWESLWAFGNPVQAYLVVLLSSFMLVFWFLHQKRRHYQNVVRKSMEGKFVLILQAHFNLRPLPKPNFIKYQQNSSQKRKPWDNSNDSCPCPHVMDSSEWVFTYQYYWIHFLPVPRVWYLLLPSEFIQQFNKSHSGDIDCIIEVSKDYKLGLSHFALFSEFIVKCFLM